MNSRAPRESNLSIPTVQEREAFGDLSCALPLSTLEIFFGAMLDTHRQNSSFELIKTSFFVLSLFCRSFDD